MSDIKQNSIKPVKKNETKNVAAEIVAEMAEADTHTQIAFNSQTLKSVNFKMRPELHKTLKAEANRQEVKLYELIDVICTEYVKNHNIRD